MIELVSDSKVIQCITGEKSQFVKKKLQIDKHLKIFTSKHTNETSKVQTFLTKRSLSNHKRKKSREKNDFTLDLCKAMFWSNIPLNKIYNPIF